jgi:hypothetical protein
MREQYHFSYIRRIRKKHREPVYADTQAAGRGHTVFEGAEEVLVNYGFGIGLCLLLEPFSLVDGVVQLGVGISYLHAAHIQFEPVDKTGSVLLFFSQRAYLFEHVDDENRMRLGHRLYHLTDYVDYLRLGDLVTFDIDPFLLEFLDPGRRRFVNPDAEVP